MCVDRELNGNHRDNQVVLDLVQTLTLESGLPIPSEDENEIDSHTNTQYTKALTLKNE